MFRYLTVTGVVLVALMTTLEPDVGFAAPAPARLLFWTLQVGAGLLVLQAVLYALTRRYGATRVSSWVLVLLSGVLGAVVLAPVYWLIGEGLMEQWLGYAPLPEDDDDESLFGIPLGHPLLEEYVHIVGPVTASWALICLPRLHWLVPPMLHRQMPVTPPRPAEVGTNRHPGSGLTVDRVDPPASVDPVADACDAPMPAKASPDLSTSVGETIAPSPRPAWCERLPPEMGSDVIAVASELQYLRVWTPRGCALILGALADVETESAALGLRVHRSWWVASRHVMSVRRTPAGAVCLMSDGSQVPVSRRRRAEVLARFSDSARYQLADASEAVSQADLH